ncbi:MAG: hypothetical protein ABW170_21095 [Candidatus Thiodiazotropha sp. L084R]
MLALYPLWRKARRVYSLTSRLPGTNRLGFQPSLALSDRIGRIANGGIREITVSRGEREAENIGKAPVTSPISRPREAAISSPSPRRVRLLIVSFQNRYSPERLLGSNAIRSIPSAI